jgi:hypothetical protein
MTKIEVKMRVIVWQTFDIDLPEEETPESFIAKLKETDPACLHLETEALEYFCETEQPLVAEYYDENEDLIDVHIF